MYFSAASYTARVAEHLLTIISLLCERGYCIYFSPKLCCLGGSLTSTIFLLLSPIHPNLFIYFLCFNGISCLYCLTSKYLFHLLVYAQDSTLQFLSDYIKEGLGHVFWLWLVPQFLKRCVCLLPDA